MKVREFFSNFKGFANVTLCNQDGNIICRTKVESEGMSPYLEREINSWGFFGGLLQTLDIVVYLDNEV